MDVPSPASLNGELNLADELAGIDGAPNLGMLGSPEEISSDREDLNDNDNRDRGVETKSTGPKPSAIRRSQSFSSVHQNGTGSDLRESLKLNLTESLRNSTENGEKSIQNGRDENDGSAALNRSSSLADLTAPRPWRQRSSFDKDDEDEAPKRPSLKERLAEAEKKYATDKFTRDLNEKIKQNRKLLSSDSDDGARSRRSLFDKADSDSDTSSYNRRRTTQLGSTLDTGKSSRFR